MTREEKGKTDVEQIKGILEEFEEGDICRAIEEMDLCVSIRKTKLGPFSALGRGAPLFQAVLDGVEYPVEDRKDLISKAGGEERLVTVSDPTGGQRVYALLDLLEVFSDELFPIASANSIIRRFAALERQRKKKGEPSLLLTIGGKHMNLIQQKRRGGSRQGLILSRKELKIPVVGVPKETSTSVGLLKAFENDASRKFFQEHPFMQRWLEWLLEFIRNYHRNAALAAAVDAQRQAVAADGAADTAEDRIQDVAGASTNTQGQQAVTGVCTKAQEAAAAAQQAANFAATACGHAGAVPDDIEAQTACSNAQTAAAQANSAANRAQDACDKAQDIASILIVTICGHVTEEDPCCDDDVSGANITVCNVDYPEIPCQNTTTDEGGNYCVTGRFGHSSRIGCANVRITMSAYGISQTKQIIVCSSSPPNVNFSFDAPGTE